MMTLLNVGLFARLKTATGLDINAFTSILAGGLSIVLIYLSLSLTQQGFYYANASVFALQVFYELGLNQVVNHDAAHLTIQDDGKVSGDAALVIQGDGAPYRSYLYAADMSARLWFAILKGRTGEVYNVDAEVSDSIPQLAKLVSRTLASPLSTP